MRGRRHDSIALPGGRRYDDPQPSVTRGAVPPHEKDGGRPNEKVVANRENPRKPVR
jgi:hypothetical protein